MFRRIHPCLLDDKLLTPPAGKTKTFMRDLLDLRDQTHYFLTMNIKEHHPAVGPGIII